MAPPVVRDPRVYKNTIPESESGPLQWEPPNLMPQKECSRSANKFSKLTLVWKKMSTCTLACFSPAPSWVFRICIFCRVGCTARACNFRARATTFSRPQQKTKPSSTTLTQNYACRLLAAAEPKKHYSRQIFGPYFEGRYPTLSKQKISEILQNRRVRFHSHRADDTKSHIRYRYL